MTNSHTLTPRQRKSLTTTVRMGLFRLADISNRAFKRDVIALARVGLLDTYGAGSDKQYRVSAKGHAALTESAD